MADGVSEVPLVLTEIRAGGGMSLSGVGRQFPGHRGGPAVDPSTVFRWATKGLNLAGRTVKLEAVRVGHRWLTSSQAVARFVAALTPVDPPPAPAPIAPTTDPARRAKAAIKTLIDQGA
ncbi:DUF1580 domain-containing protein [Urbifossiella limnaea]|uniref:DUF1580 domain-containing protein n=1 Tax=Urbifossiella limnaea TaxID=2528023 RepID=A0A517XT37_9BACT|nr:DUF1580 domain-containing protein [Urbifossiella limnaea]QDU20661.1 hypothetical protein ETAA1_26180 [Urbifossiella limnaea]